MARPKADITAKQIEGMISRGLKVTEIADILGVHRDTIHDRFPTEIAKGRGKLRESLRKHQLRAAERGNATMLVWLGKQYLGQSDTSIDDYLLEAIESAGLTKEELLDLIKQKDNIAAAQGKRTFREFCVKAGYPEPFPKQEAMLAFARETKEPSLLLGSRGYGKTDYVTALGLGYLVYLDPEEFSALIITKSKNRNTAILGEISNALRKNGIQLEKENSEVLRAQGKHGKDGSIEALTIGSSGIRGRHPKLVVMDDPVTPEDTSEAVRAKAKKVYNEVIKLTQAVLVIGQPVHKYDLFEEIRPMVRKMELPYGSIPELDPDLDAQRAAGVDEASISASYFLRVLSEGTTPFDKVKYVDAFPTGDSAVAFIDPSEGGDYTAVTILKAYMQGIAAVGFVYKKAWNHCLDDLAPELMRYKVKRLCFETNCTGDQPVEMLRGLFPGIGISGRRSTNNKHSRIMAAGAFAHLIHLSKQSHKLYLDHVVKYEYKAKFDDAPDSLATCLEWIGLVRGKL